MRNTEIQRPFAHTDDATWRRGAPTFADLEQEAKRDAVDRRRARWTLTVAALIHTVLLIVALPNRAEPEVVSAGNDRPVFVVQQVRFQPPPPRQQKPIPKKKAKKIPIPDPTPDDPEPFIEDLEIPLEPTLETDFDGLTLGIPDAPPGPPGPVGVAGPPGVFEVGGAVSAPVKVHAPQPLYTETARAARIQGVVILQAIVNAEGRVESVKVLKGLPEGLSDSSIETIKTWVFEPAKKDGVPVPVYFNLTVRFSLQ